MHNASARWQLMISDRGSSLSEARAPGLRTSANLKCSARKPVERLQLAYTRAPQRRGCPDH